MTEIDDFLITPEVAMQKAVERLKVSGGNTDSVTRAIISIAAGGESASLPEAYKGLPSERRVLSDSVLSELGHLLVGESTSGKNRSV